MHKSSEVITFQINFGGWVAVWELCDTCLDGHLEYLLAHITSCMAHSMSLSKGLPFFPQLCIQLLYCTLLAHALAL